MIAWAKRYDLVLGHHLFLLLIGAYLVDRFA